MRHGEDRVDRNETKINDDLREDTKTKITAEKYCWYIFVDSVIWYRLMIEQKSFGYETIENEKNLLSSKLHVKSMWNKNVKPLQVTGNEPVSNHLRRFSYIFFLSFL